MDTIVLKFGGSSVSDNINLNIVANKIIELKTKVTILYVWFLLKAKQQIIS